MKTLTKLKNELIVAMVFVLSRLPNLGWDNFNTDVWKWKYRIYDFGNGIFTLHLEKTIQKYHPGVTLMWLGSFAVKVYNLFYDVVLKRAPLDNNIGDIFELHFFQKLFVVAAIGITFAFIFYALRKLFGTTYAYVTLTFMALEPFYVGLSREVHLEGLMTVFMLAAFVYAFYYLTDKTRYVRLYTSAVFAALAVLTKTSSAMVVVFIGLLLFIDYATEIKNWLGVVSLTLSTYLKWLGMTFVIFSLVWPAMWIMPVEALKTMYTGVSEVGIEGGHEQIYYGKLTDDPGPLYYLVVFGLKTSPQLLLGLVGSLLVCVLIYQKLGKKSGKFVFFAVLMSLLYLVEITIPSKKLDRYVVPSIMLLWFVASMFYTWLIEALQEAVTRVTSSTDGQEHSTTARVLFAVVLAGLFIYPVGQMILVHPDYYSYFNPLLGGLQRGIAVLEPKWLIGGREIVDVLSELKRQEGLEDFGPEDNFEGMTANKRSHDALDRKLTVGFQEKYYIQIWPFVELGGGQAVINDLTPYAIHTKYFVYPVWDDDSINEDRFTLKFVRSVHIRGVEVYRVYERV